MHIKDIPWKGLSSGRTSEQKRQLAVGYGMACQIIIHNQNIPALAHEILPRVVAA